MRALLSKKGVTQWSARAKPKTPDSISIYEKFMKFNVRTKPQAQEKRPLLKIYAI